MNIALLIDYYPPNHDGGDSIFARDLAIGLKNLVNPLVFTRLPEKKHTTEFDDNGIRVIYLGDNWKSDISSYVDSIDLVHFFQVDNMPLVDFISSQRKTPVIFHMEMSYKRYSELFEADFNEKIKHSLEKKAVSISDAVIIPCQNETEEVLRIYRQKIQNKSVTIPNGINYSVRLLNPFDSKEEHGQTKFAFIGRLDDQMKGGELLLDTLAQLPESYLQRSHYLFVGCRDTTFLDKLNSFNKNISYEAHAWISNEEKLWEKLSDVKYMLIPSYYETFGMVCLESMAMGIIPIASNAGAMGEIIQNEESGFSYIPNNKVELSDRIIKAIDMPYERYTTMRRKSIEQSRDRYNIDQIADEIMILYNNLTGGVKDD